MGSRWHRSGDVLIPEGRSVLLCVMNNVIFVGTIECLIMRRKAARN